MPDLIEMDMSLKDMVVIGTDIVYTHNLISIKN
jgi:hypothetical protein